MQRLLILSFALLIETLAGGQPARPQADEPPYEILVVKGSGSVRYLARADGSQPRVVPADLPLADPDAWSPDRRQIAFPCADGLVQFINERGLGQFVQELDAEQGFVAFKEAGAVPSSMLCIVSADGSSRERLVDFPVMATSILAPSILAWSPDSTRLAFVSNFSDDRQPGNPGIEAFALCVIDIRTRQIVRLRHNFEKAFPFAPASWSRDGRRIAFSSYDGDLYVVDVNEGVSQRIAAGAAAPGTAVFSPQEDRIAFFGAGGVFTIKPDGSDQRRVWSGEVFPFGLRWSPDGRFLFIKRWNRVIDVQTGTTVGELEEAGRDHVFTPDSRHIVYACCLRAPTAGPPPVASDAIYSVAVDGSDKRKVSDGDAFVAVPTGSPAPLAGSRRTSGGRIRGRVTAADSGVALGQAEVRAYGKSIITDGEGHYELTELPPGHYSLDASKREYTRMSYGQRQPTDLGKDIDLAEAQVLDGINFALPRTAILAGRVLDELDRPVADVEMKGCEPQSCKDNDGSFRLASG
jgi:hypothetical protein